MQSEGGGREGAWKGEGEGGRRDKKKRSGNYLDRSMYPECVDWVISQTEVV